MSKWEVLSKKVRTINPNVRFIFHIGYPKTATTSLQYCFYNNRKLLRDRGIFYPIKDTVTAKHSKFIRWIFNNEEEEIFDFFRTVINNTTRKDKIVLLSLEGISFMLSRMPKKGFDLFRKIIELFNFEFVVVLRNPYDFLWSWFKQCLINPPNNPVANEFGKSISFKDFGSLPSTVELIDYEYFYSLLERMFPTSTIQLVGKGRNIYSQFFEIIDDDLNINELNLFKQNKSMADSLAPWLVLNNRKIEKHLRLRKFISKNRSILTTDKRKTIKDLAFSELSQETIYTLNKSLKFLKTMNLQSEVDSYEIKSNSENKYSEEFKRCVNDSSIDIMLMLVKQKGL